jgi:endonuclease/exonuclease/phosphatase family metal-dependent hydrolase
MTFTIISTAMLAMKKMTAGENDFSVITTNLRFGLAQDGDNSWPNREPLFALVLKRYPATFLGVQESNHFQTRFLKDTLKDHAFIGWHNQSNERWQSNLIFYHNSWECIQHKHHFLSDTPDVESRLLGSKWPRQCTIGLFKKDDHRIVMANTHFDFDESVQEKSAKLVMKFLSAFPNNCPVIITGDFNASPDSRAYLFFREKGFFEVFDNAYSTTFHKFKGEATLDHIDWILYRGNIKKIQKKIITDSFNGCYPSDHYPVMATFSFCLFQ